MSSEGVSGTETGGGVRFLGVDRDYWRLLIRGAVLLAFTLGIYRFWLLTDIRRFLWSNSEVSGEALEYSGTPQELLIGFMMAIVILVPIYTGFFLAALDLGTLGQLSSGLAFVALAVLGQYAIYRARRYRLTRTVFRGLRFHQEGSAWLYAFWSIFWWTLTILTLGLAYPFQLASLERYKMRKTYYGELAGSFVGSGWRLFLRGLPMWLALFVPLALAVGVAVAEVDVHAIGAAMAAPREGASESGQGGAPPTTQRQAPTPSTNPGSVDSGTPGRSGSGSSSQSNQNNQKDQNNQGTQKYQNLDQAGGVVAFAILMGIVSVLAGVGMFPAFQAMVLRWQLSGVRFGEFALLCKLRTRDIYKAYLRFLGTALIFSVVIAMVGSTGAVIVKAIVGDNLSSGPGQIMITGVLLVLYVISMLGYSTIYRGTVELALWRKGFESLQLSGLSALENVKASGKPASALGEGLVDALHVGGF